MNTFVHTLHRLSSPQTFDQFAARWAPRCYCTALILMIPALWQALIVLPPEHYMGDSVRIVYLHVPSAWMSLFIFGLMALYATIALVWRIKLCEILAMACAPSGAAFTLITLLTGSLWGRSTWGTFWDWDPRLTSELILLFLYLGVIGLSTTPSKTAAPQHAPPDSLPSSAPHCYPSSVTPSSGGTPYIKDKPYASLTHQACTASPQCG